MSTDIRFSKKISQPSSGNDTGIRGFTTSVRNKEMVRNILHSILVIFILASCQNKNDINKIVLNHWQQDSINCIVDFSSCFSFNWDRCYYFSSKCSLEEIDKDLGIQFNEFKDTSDRLIFVQDKRIVYTQDWYYSPEKTQTGVMFDYGIRKLEIKSRDAKFRVEKKHGMYLLTPIYK